MRTLLPLAALALAAAPLPALACSVVPGYRVPTNIELVQRADVILLGIVEDGDPESGSSEEMMIRVQPVEALKGEWPTEPVALPAMIAPDAEFLLSNPYELKDAHPQSLAGACNRYAFPRGSRVLFFLDHRDGNWRPVGSPFSRWAEDVLTDEAPWLQLVRFYVEIADLPDDQRVRALTARRDEWRARGDDPVAQLLAADIDRQLAGPDAPLRDELPEMAPSEVDEEAADAGEAMAADAEAAATDAEAAVTDVPPGRR